MASQNGAPGTSIAPLMDKSLCNLNLKGTDQRTPGVVMNEIMNSRARLALYLGILAALALSGCGARKTARNKQDESTFSSRTVHDDGIFCNRFSSEETKLEGKMMTYTAPDGTAHDDIIRLRLNGLNNTFDTNSKYTIKIFRWSAMADGNGGTPEEAEFRLELPSSATPLSGYMNYINMADVTRIKNQYGITATKAEDFFRQVDFLVFDVDLTWDVLKIVLYEAKSASDWVSIGDADALIPAFSANPNTYAEDHVALLTSMHPFWNDRTRADTTNFSSLSQSWCF